MGGMVRWFFPDGDLDLAVFGNLEALDETGAKTVRGLQGLGRAKNSARLWLCVLLCPIAPVLSRSVAAILSDT